MKFLFASTPTFEPWDWTNPEGPGIGGSETSHIEMSIRLRALGHRVVSYVPSPWTEDCEHAGVTWKHSDEQIAARLAVEEADVWVIYRAPELADVLPPQARQVWLICQDVDYTMEGRELTPARAARFTRIVALCQAHADYLRSVHPAAAAQVCQSSNGIKTDRIRETLDNPPERKPYRLLYASSPDRGLEFLLPVFERVREHIPGATLHVAYGFDNIEKVVKALGPGSFAARNAERLRNLLQQPGVTWLGRIGQAQLRHEWAQASLWVHPSNFTETSCITCMDAQALGAIPVTSPVWAIAENVQWGVFIEGDVRNPLIQSRYALETIRLLLDPDRQTEIRPAMQLWALNCFDWDLFAHQWDTWAAIDRRTSYSIFEPNGKAEPEAAAK